MSLKHVIKMPGISSGRGDHEYFFSITEEGLTKAHIFTPTRPNHSVVEGETGGGKMLLLNPVPTRLVGQELRPVPVVLTKGRGVLLTAIMTSTLEGRSTGRFRPSWDSPKRSK